MDIRILGAGDEALLVDAVTLTDKGPISHQAAARHPDDVMFDFD